MSLRVLLADKSKTMRKIIRTSLRAVGEPETVEAANGDETLELFKKSDFDLVLTDWDMPGKSGLDLIHAIRAHCSRVPVVTMSTDVNRRRIMMAIDAGVSEHLIKPFSPQTRIKLGKLLRRVKYQSLHLENETKWNVEFINPFLVMVASIFETTLGCELTRGEPFLMKNRHPQHDVSGVVCFSGGTHGTVVLSLGDQVALRVTEAMTKRCYTEINDTVRDVVGELTNVISGNSQPEIESPGLCVSPPQVITGKNERIEFPAGVTLVCIPFTSGWGPVSVQVGLVEQPAEAVAG